MLLVNYRRSLDIVHGARTTAAFPATAVKERRKGKKERKKEGKKEAPLSSQPVPCSLRRAQLSSLSPGWCGEWRVSGIVTGANSTSRQFGFEA